MTKNQINYLLALLTLVVIWLFLNTITMVGVKASYMNQFGMRSQGPGMMMPMQMPSQSQRLPSQMSPETQRMIEQFRNARMNPSSLSSPATPAPADAGQEKK